MSTVLSEAERATLLDDQIERFAWGGWRLTTRTPTTAQLVKPKQFSAVAAILWFLVCGVGVLVYLFLYLAQQDEMVILTIREQGQVNGQWRHGGSPWPKLPGDWTCPQCAYINRMERLVCLRCGLSR
jgi:rubredoxin